VTTDDGVRCKATGCGRALRTAESKARGMGTVCWERRHPRPARHHIAAGPSTSTRPSPAPPGPDLLDELDGTP
jgi:hypothetical protein